MNNKKKKALFTIIVIIAAIILISIGSTFAYFTATISSEEGAVSMTAAEFEIDLIEDISLIKTSIIPSAEKFVDYSLTRVDENGNFIKPYKENDRLITAETVCVDDNLNEICSVYTFTIQNPMTESAIPLYVTLNPSINTFGNLYYKVLNEDKEEIMGAKKLIDDRPYQLDENGEKIFLEGSKISPEILTAINRIVLPKAESEDKPSEATFSIVLWVMETGTNQTDIDSGQVFAGTIHVSTNEENSQGITGTFSAGGIG